MATATAKKIFLPLIALLEANSQKTVKSVLPEIMELCSSKGAGGVATASHKIDGKVVAVRCSFFEKWFPISHVPFGNKEGSATGLNPMCKEGANMFSQMQREYKKGKEAILDRVAKGELAPEKIQAELQKLEKARTNRPEYSVPGLGFDNLEDLLATKPAVFDKAVKEHEAAVKAAEEEQARKDKAEADKKAAAESKAGTGGKVAPNTGKTK